MNELNERKNVYQPWIDYTNDDQLTSNFIFLIHFLINSFSNKRIFPNYLCKIIILLEIMTDYILKYTKNTNLIIEQTNKKLKKKFIAPNLLNAQILLQLPFYRV